MTQHVSITLPDSVSEESKTYAQRTGRTLSSLCAQGLQLMLDASKVLDCHTHLEIRNSSGIKRLADLTKEEIDYLLGKLVRLKEQR